jgi:iron complex outermembrane recepter protein
MRAIHARAALLGTAAAAAHIATPAIAQTATTAPPSAAATNDQTQDSATGQIVITARRTEEKLQRVPASVSAFNARALDRIQAQDTTGLQGAVPNLNIVAGRGSSNATNIFIRGIGQPDALQTFDPAVGVYVDDVYLSRIRGSQLDLLDLDRIEVLRGPQGTLYGKNTIGGAIKFVTRRPDDTLRASGSIAGGSYDQLEGKGTLSGPISQGFDIGVSVLGSRRDGFVEDAADDREYNNKKTVAGRVAVALNPTSKIRVDLTADYQHDNAALNVGRPVNDLLSAFGLTLPVSNAVGTGSYHWTGRTTPGLPNSTKLTHYGFAGTAAVDLTDALTVKSITAYRNLKTRDFVDIDASEWQLGDVFVGVNQKQFSQEFQLAYTGRRLSAVGGLYYLYEHITSHQEAYANDFLRFSLLLPPFTFTRFIDDDLRTKSYAGYANATYEVVPNVRLSAGIRYTHETKDYDRLTTITSTFAPFPPFPFAPPRGKWSDWSPMASVDWQVTPSTMLYARVAKGFKSGGFNGRANSPTEATEYAPEKVWSYEGGFKTTIANQLRLNGAVFHSDYKDFQARVAGTVDDPNSPIDIAVLSVINAGKLRIRGAELEAAWTPVTGLLIDGQLGYLDAKYRVFDDARFTNFGGSRAFQTPAFAPKWTLRLGAQYAFNLNSAGSITVGGQTRYRSRQALAVDNTFFNTDTKIEGLFQNGYWIHDARIVWENQSKKYSVGLYGYNLTKKAYKTDAQEFSSVGNIRTVYYGAPRTVTLRLTARY